MDEVFAVDEMRGGLMADIERSKNNICQRWGIYIRRGDWMTTSIRGLENEWVIYTFIWRVV